jgi:hypothetical protein
VSRLKSRGFSRGRKRVVTSTFSSERHLVNNLVSFDRLSSRTDFHPKRSHPLIVSFPKETTSADALLGDDSGLENRSQLKRDYPVDLSILLTGGKETNKDSPSNGE